MAYKGVVKKKMLCPFCLEDSGGKEHRIIAYAGMGPHVRKSHPDRYDDFLANREKYVEQFKCDAKGNPLNKREVDVPVISENDEIKSAIGNTEFTHVPISVVPDLSQIEDNVDLLSIINKPDDEKSEKGKTTDTKSVAFVGGQPFVESPTSTDFEACLNISNVFWSFPSWIWGQHLVIEDSKVRSFARTLESYCVTKDIDPNTWFFDEFGLLLVSLGMLVTLKTKHAAHKKEQGVVSKKVEKDQAQKTTYIQE